MPQPRPGTILLVEDDLLNQEVTQEVLELLDVDVYLASDGRKAVAMSRERCFDLILMDLHMPGLTGLQATREIRAESLNTRTPVVALTADVSAETQHACAACGIDATLYKPIGIDELCERVMQWLPSPSPRHEQPA